jgi:hypothetical protein
MSKYFVREVTVMGANAQKLSSLDADRIEGILRADEAMFAEVNNFAGVVVARSGIIEFDDAETELDVVRYYAVLLWMELNRYVEVKVASTRIDISVPITATRIQFRRIADDSVSE